MSAEEEDVVAIDMSALEGSMEPEEPSLFGGIDAVDAVDDAVGAVDVPPQHRRRKHKQHRRSARSSRHHASGGEGGGALSDSEMQSIARRYTVPGLTSDATNEQEVQALSGMANSNLVRDREDLDPTKVFQKQHHHRHRRPPTPVPSSSDDEVNSDVTEEGGGVADDWDAMSEAFSEGAARRRSRHARPARPNAFADAFSESGASDASGASDSSLDTVARELRERELYNKAWAAVNWYVENGGAKVPDEWEMRKPTLQEIEDWIYQTREAKSIGAGVDNVRAMVTMAAGSIEIGNLFMGEPLYLTGWSGKLEQDLKDPKHDPLMLEIYEKYFRDSFIQNPLLRLGLVVGQSALNHHREHAGIAEANKKAAERAQMRAQAMPMPHEAASARFETYGGGGGAGGAGPAPPAMPTMPTMAATQIEPFILPSDAETASDKPARRRRRSVTKPVEVRGRTVSVG